MITITLTFLVCWWPYIIIFMLGDSIPWGENKGIILWNFVTLAYSQSLINPVLYISINREVRRNVGKLFCCPGQRLASLDLVFATTNIMFRNLGFKQEDAKSVTSC